MCAYTQPAHREGRGTGTVCGTGMVIGTATVSRGIFSVIMASPPFFARHTCTALHKSRKIAKVTTGGTAVANIMAISPFEQRCLKRFDLHTRLDCVSMEWQRDRGLRRPGQ
jgi:hypothetical protein